MRDSNGNTLAVGQTVAFHTWDETDPAAPIRVDQSGVIKELCGEVARNQTLGEVLLESGPTLPALAVTVLDAAPTPAAPAVKAKRKTAPKKK